MIGRTISHYRILSQLGSGGMGVVYRAEDLRLKRIVALKFLPPELTRDETAKARFIHEAQAASALQHQNICTIHEIDETPDGQLFISMECYDGETLREKIARGPLPVEEAVHIVCQAAAGLSKAHAAGMVHRDVKPANVMVTSDGDVKLLDFGIAKLAGVTKVTRTGAAIGTVAYMSPEQARGEEVDARSDIFSLGTVFYEMLTGKVPFPGDHEAAVLYGIMNTDPKPVADSRSGVPTELGRIVSKMLSRAPSDRYPSLGDFLTDVRALEKRGEPLAGNRAMRRRRRNAELAILAAAVLVAAGLPLVRSISADRPGKIDSIAVLPLDNLSKDPEQEYFADGMTEALITDLAKIGAIKVVSRTSVMRFKGSREPLPKIARALGVDAVVEGSVLLVGDRVRINAQLLEAGKDRHIWADSYERDIRDVFAIQHEVARAVVAAIKVRLTPAQTASLGQVAQVDPKVHEAYLRGRYYWNKRTRDGLERSIGYFKSAVDMDSTFALGYAGLAEAYIVMVTYGYGDLRELYALAERNAEKAIAIDSELSPAYAALAGVKVFFEFDYQAAERLYKEAIALDPGNSTAHQWYAEYLSYRGRHEEALGESDKALEVDPLSRVVNASKAMNLYRARRYEEAMAQGRKAQELGDESARTYTMESLCYRAMGRYADCVAAFQRNMSRDEKGRAMATEAGGVFARSGIRGFYRWQVEHIDEFSESSIPYRKVQLYALLGEKDRAVEWMQKVIEMRAEQAQWWITDPALDDVRDDPTFRAAIRKAGLEG